MNLVYWLASGPDPFGQTLTQSARTNRIRAGFAQYDSGRLWKKTTESDSGKLIAGQLRSAKTGPVDYCTPTRFLTRCVWPKPDQAIQIGPGPVLHITIGAFFERTESNRMQEVGSGIYDPGRFWLTVMAITKTLPNRVWLLHGRGNRRFLQLRHSTTGVYNCY